MIVKLVSLVNLICVVAISSLNLKNASDPMFFIVAGGVGANLVRILLAGLMISAAFVSLPKKWRFEPGLLFLGFLLVALGISGFVLNSFDYALYNYIKPLDFLIISEAGIVASLVALEAHKPIFRFKNPYQRTFTIAFLPRLRDIKPATA
jgi:hypothetical protein